MKRKNKMLFLAITLATVLILTSAVNATNTTDHNTDHTLSEKTSTPATSEIKETTINKEKITSKNNKMEEKTINKTDKTEKQTKKDSITIDGIEYTNIVENQEIISDEYIEINDKTIINNCYIRDTNAWGYYFTNYAYINNSIIDGVFGTEKDIFIHNSTLNCELQIEAKNANIIIDDYTQFGDDFKLAYGTNMGNFIINDSSRMFPNNYDGNQEITNKNIIKDITIPETGNITFTQCNISAKITNNGNLTLINCSLSNNNMTTTGSKTDGFLLENKGNMTMIDCIVENNTFNMTLTYNNDVELYGAIVNSGLLNVVNSSFRNNCLGYAEEVKTPGAYYKNSYTAGSGSCIVNKPNALLNITSSTFYSNYAGRHGGAIYSEGKLTIIDSEFDNNTATTRGATIYEYASNNQEISIDITKTNFTNNTIAYVQRNNVQSADYDASVYLRSNYRYDNVYKCRVNIDECTFQNEHRESSTISRITNVYICDMVATVNNSDINGQLVIEYSGGNYYNTTLNNITNNRFQKAGIGGTSPITDAKIENNIFNDSTIVLTRNFELCNNTITNNSMIFINLPIDSQVDDYKVVKMHDNIFENNTIGGNFIQYVGSNREFISLYEKYNNTYINNALNDTITLELPIRIYKGEAVNLKAVYDIISPEYYDADILEQNQFQIYVNGKLEQTLDTPEFTLTPNGNTQLIIQPSISTNNKIIQIKPITLADNITITPENINTYTYNGEIIGIDPNSRIFFKGNFTNTQLYIKTSNLEIDGKEANFTNSIFTIEEENIILQNIHINNTETEYPITNTGDNNIIQNNTITLKNTQGKTAAIYNKASNTIIQNNILYVDGPALDIDHSQGYGTANTQAILLIGGDKNKVTNNKITVTTTTTSETFGTIEGITNHNEATKTQITRNNITMNGSRFNYGINSLNNVENINISENNIQSTGERYTCGIQVGNGATDITIDNNNITATCHNTTTQDEEAITFGIVTTNMGDYRTTQDISINYNNINLTGTVNYGIEIYQTHNARSQYNNITATGTYSMGIGYAHSPHGRIQYNRIRLTGDSRQPIGQVTEDLPPENVGILIEIESEDKTISGNHITVYDKGLQSHSIKLKSGDISLNGKNWATADDKTMEDTLYLAPGIRVSLEGAYPPWVAFEKPDSNYTRLDFTLPETSILGKTITIQVNLTDDYYGTPILNNGEGYTRNFILQINNETSTITINNQTNTYEFTPQETGEYNITITFPETYYYYPSTQTKTINVIPKPVSHTNTSTENITIGESTTLTAQFYDDDDQQITSGKVIFKVNGKTIRDNNGNVIYAEIIGGQATLPDVNITQEWMKPDTTIQAVYVGNDNNEPITTTPTTVTVTKPEATITLEAPTEATAGTTITLKATVTDGENNITSGRVAFKLNGKTLKNAEGKALYANVENGIATLQYTIPEKTKAKEYTLTAVFTNTLYDRKETNSTLNVVKA